MSVQREPVRAAIYIYSMHPLAFQRIRNLILENGISYQAVRSITLEEVAPEPAVDPSILLIDTCSVSTWAECALRWQASGGRTLLLVMPQHWKQSDNLRILFLGISGVVPITDHIEEDLPCAIDSIDRGGLWVDSAALYVYAKKKMGPATWRPQSAIMGLTSREEEIAIWVANGFANKEIAGTLEISERTVKFHVSNILRKYHAQNRRHLIAMIVSDIRTPSGPGARKQAGLRDEENVESKPEPGGGKAAFRTN